MQLRYFISYYDDDDGNPEPHGLFRLDLRDPKTLIEERWWGDEGWKETDMIMPVLLFGEWKPEEVSAETAFATFPKAFPDGMPDTTGAWFQVDVEPLTPTDVAKHQSGGHDKTSHEGR